MKNALLIGIFYCLIAVILGAYASHGLKSVLSAYELNIVEIGVKFQFYHGLGLIVIGFIHDKIQSYFSLSSIILMGCGTALFSGSLYLLALFSVSWLGPVTPLGGLCLILGWLSVFVAVLRFDFSALSKSK